MGVMGGYEPKRKARRLVFPPDGDMAGLEVAMRSVSIDQMLTMAAIADKVKGEDEPSAAEIEYLFKRFGGALKDWNVTNDGQPVPAAYAVCTVSGHAPAAGTLLPPAPRRCAQHSGAAADCVFAGVCTQDLDFIMAIFEAWFEAATSVDPTSPGGSPSGGSSPEAALAQASQSLSPGS